MAKKLVLIVLVGIALLASADNALARPHRGGGHYNGGYCGSSYRGGGHYGGYYRGRHHGGRYYSSRNYCPCYSGFRIVIILP